MNVIEISHLTKSYGKSRGIADLSLNVEEGDFFGFIGPNGSGKSTTIRTLLGLIHASSGSAKLFGQDIGSVKLLSNIGYMPSEAMFYSGMRVREVISYSAKLYKKECCANAAQLCERLQLDTNKKISELSLGNRKKVGIVCAMQHEPSLYILDEPTSGLDPLMQKEFFDLLHERHKQGATIFLSSHILNEIQKHCSKAAIIRDGSILTCDSVDNLSRTKARRITISGINYIPDDINAKSVKITDTSVSFLYSGEFKPLLLQLSSLDISDLSITEPDLEEIFMHYYAQ